MCFLIRATMPGSKARGRKTLAGPVPGTDGRLRWTLSVSRGHPLELVVPGEACPCALLGGQADSNVSAWTLAPEWSPLIAKAMAHLVKGAETDVLVWATWCGEPAPNRKVTDLASLTAEIMSSRLMNRTEYLVRFSKRP